MVVWYDDKSAFFGHLNVFDLYKAVNTIVEQNK